ncbi:MAG: glycogen/starch synthase, partial [Clostridia bacterium]|nr:glycogen/starch synthase [Clostridia bacterium]
GARFNFFCKAALAALPYLKLSPQVIHCNDWQTALIPLFLKVKLTDDPYYNNMGTLLTIHNLQYQGHFDRGILRTLALGDEFFTPEKLEFYGRVNFLKAGLIYADVLNTVSKKYALEIQTPEMGEGLDGVLRTRAKDLYGIINGIDYDEFNPETDPHIKVNYNIDTWEKKRENKTFLQNELDLENKDVPLIGMVTRLVEQKGIDLVGSIADQLASLDVQFVLLGAGEDRYQEMFTKLALKYRRK